MSPETYLLAALLVYLIAGAVKGLLGIGMPTMAIGLMAQLGDPREAVATVLVPMLVANAWQVSRSAAPRALIGRTLRDYRPLALTMFAGIGAVALLAPRLSPTLVALVLGGVMALFAATSLWREPPPLPMRHDTAAQLFTGTCAGVLGGISGIWAPPIIVYLGARRLAPSAFVETVGVLLFGGCVVLVLGYAASGALSGETALRSLALIPSVIAGYALGERGRARLSGTAFRKLVLAFFLLMGLNLVRRALGGEL